MLDKGFIDAPRLGVIAPLCIDICKIQKRENIVCSKYVCFFNAELCIGAVPKLQELLAKC